MASSRPFGVACRIGVLLLLAQGLAGQSVTYEADIAPLVHRQCTPCHQPGAIGPMPFTNYEEVAAYGAMIAYVVAEKYMPPWPPDPAYRHFAGERALTEAEIRRIQDWVAAGLPRGGPPEANAGPKPVQAAPEAELADADVEYAMAEAFEQYGIYFDQYQVFVLETDLAEDRWVDAIAFIPGNREIVRYASIALDAGDRPQELDRWDPRYGYFSFGGPGYVAPQVNWYTWSAGDGPWQSPAGTARFLPRAARLLLYVHYGPTGRPALDSSRLQIRFADAPPRRVLHNVPLINPAVLTQAPFRIPAGQTRRFHASVTLPQAIELRSLEPHSLLLGRSWELFARLPDGTVERLLKIPNWDFHWRYRYRFPHPIELPAGTTLHALAEYDNRADNPALAVDPPIDTGWGFRVYEEQFWVHFQYTLAAATPQTTLRILPDFSNLRTATGTLRLQIPTPGTYTLQVTNWADPGQRSVAGPDRLSAGLHTRTLDLRALPPGNYTARLRDTDTGAAAIHHFVYWPAGY